MHESLLGEITPVRLIDHTSQHPDKPKGSLWGSIANLCATAMGTGILALPIAVYYCGYLLGTALLCLMAIVSDLSLIFLLRAARVSGAQSFDGLAKFFFGKRGSMLVTVMLILLLFGACVSILIVIGDLSTVHIQTWTHSHDFFTSHPIMMLFALCLIFPLCLFKTLSALSTTSSSAIFSILFVSGCLLVRFGQHGQGSSPVHAFPPTLHDVPFVVLALPIQSLAFSCQFNVVEIYCELEPRHQHKMPLIVHVAIFTITIFYATFGVVGYLMFGEDTKHHSNILTAFHHDTLIEIGSVFVLLTNLLKYPLIFLPFRAVVLDFIKFPQDRLTNVGFIGFSAAMNCVVYGCAVACGNLGLAFQLIGCTVGMLVCFILPGLFYHAASIIEREHGNTWYGGLPLAVFGGVMSLVTFSATVYKIAA